MKATFSQIGTAYSFEFNGVKQDRISKVVGTACNRFFEFVSVCKANNVKSFEFNKPICLTILNEQDIPLFDSFENEEFTGTLKLQRTREGLKRFANRTLNVITFALSAIEVKSVDEL